MRKANKEGLQYRWRPTYGRSAIEQDDFLGYAGPFDVWYGPQGVQYQAPGITIVGPDSTKINRGGHNFDAYELDTGGLVIDGVQDLNIDPYHMCLIYQLCEENNVFVREDTNG